MNRFVKYVDQAHEVIDSLVSEAEKYEIDLNKAYRNHSKGFRLQKDLDHVGRDLMYLFVDGSSRKHKDKKSYDSLDACLERLEGILSGRFVRHMGERKKRVAENRSLFVG
jgi:hypothetical protein